MLPHRHCLFLTALAFGALHCVAQTTAQAVAPAPNPTATPVDAAVADVSPWDISSTLRASAGWRDNVTISSVRSISRPFWRAEAESFIVRPIGEHWQFISFLNGDVLRYFNPPEFDSGDQRVRVSGDQQWVADLMARWQPLPRLRTTLKGVGFLEDTFIDPSQSEGEQLPATSVQFSGAYVALGQRVSLPGGFSIEPSLQEKKIDFKRGYTGDYTESRPGAVVEWKRSDRLVLTASWYDHQRHYSHLTASGGHAFRTRLLGLRQREGELKAASTFEAHGKWTVGLIGGVLRNRDRVNGFLDYNQQRAQIDLGWERASWRLTLSGEAKRLEYLNQVVASADFSTTTQRVTDVYDVTARVERDLNKRWTIFAENRWERSRSNIIDPLFRYSYRTNTSLVGVQRSF